MPRDSSGNYTLPAGNPVISGTTITSNWANTTMPDIGNEITDSLSRSGQGGMLAPLFFADGNVNAPGMAFVLEPTLGWYRPSTSVMALAALGNTFLNFNATDNVLTLPESGAKLGIGMVAPGANFQNLGTTILGVDQWPTNYIGKNDNKVYVGDDIGPATLIVQSAAATVDANQGGSLYLGAKQTNATLDMSWAFLFGGRENATSGNAASYFSVSTMNAAATTLEAFRVDSGQNFLVGKIADSIGTTGHQFFASGLAYHTVSGARVLRLNRLSDDGNILEISKDSSLVGVIGADVGNMAITASNTLSLTASVNLTMDGQIGATGSGTNVTVYKGIVTAIS